TPTLWVHRRVETMHLIDSRTIRRRVSVDLSVPDIAPLISDTRSRVLLPITLLEKRVMTNFDARDEDMRPVPVLTTEQNGRLAAGGIKLGAEESLGEGVEPMLLVMLTWLVAGTRRQRRGAELLIRTSDGALRWMAQMRHLAQDEVFADRLDRLRE